MSECEHTPHNWDLVYQCRGCGEIVPEEMAQKHDAAIATKITQLEAENDGLKDKLMDINVECLDKTATRESILVILLADTKESE